MPVLETKNLEKILNTARYNRKFTTESSTDFKENSVLSFDDTSSKSDIDSEDELISRLSTNERLKPSRKVIHS